MWNSSVSNGTRVNDEHGTPKPNGTSNQIFKKAARDENKPNTIIDVAGTKIGGGNFAVIAGPCSVESPKQIIDIAS